MVDVLLPASLILPQRIVPPPNILHFQFDVYRLLLGHVLYLLNCIVDHVFEVEVLHVEDELTVLKLCQV
jgi:hypothetical protein